MKRYFRIRVAVAVLGFAGVGAATFVVARARQTTPPANSAVPHAPVPLVTGKYLTPQGTQENVGSFPANLVLSPDGKFAVASSLGRRSRLTVLDIQTGKTISSLDFEGLAPFNARQREGLYYGLAFGPATSTGAMLYASRGSDDRVEVCLLRSDGQIARTNRELVTPSSLTGKPRDGKPGARVALQIAGVAASRDGTRLYAANNTGDPNANMTSSLSIIDTASGNVVRTVTLPGYSFGVVVRAGANKDEKVYVSSEQRGVVSVIEVATGKVSTTIETGAAPNALLMNRAQTRVFVANGTGDTISVIDTNRDRVTKTVVLRPPDARDIPSASPTGLALSPDERTLFVTLADMNAVAVVDVDKGTVTGYIPVGWYPTAVIVSPDGKQLLVANAKGVALRNPNGVAVTQPGGKPSRYIQDIIEGTVSRVDLTAALSDRENLTRQVLANNRVRPDVVKAARTALKNPGIEHVIYIIKENRTYDQILGDLPGGNGDPSLVLFGREVTPNLHALAERFVLLDNFYCCAEVSGDGWNWSTAGYAPPYVERNVAYGYTGKAHPYDYEGNNNTVAVDRFGIPNVARPGGGYIWENCANHKVTFRNYGAWMGDFDLPRTTAEEGSTGAKNEPFARVLVNHASPDFRQFDTSYADSEAWVKWGVAPAPHQRTTNGDKKDPSRMTAWLREFAGFVKDGKMPSFQMLRLGRDHTNGTTAGQSSPRAMVADNDYAIGQLVEAVSRSPYWKNTVICVVEDDAQAGYDHVDAHRSTAYVISLFVRQGTRDSRFYNTDSMLHTMENLLNLPPMTLYDAIASPIAVFTEKPENDTPFTAILPAREIIGEVNTQIAYRSKDSARLLNPMKEESEPDEELNDILWHAIKGRDVPAPTKRYTLHSFAPHPARHDDDD